VSSPYERLTPDKWRDQTHKLVNEHPLDTKELVEVVLTCWESIFASKMGTKGFKLGKDIFPKPQIMGFLLHELIPLELAARYPKLWRGEKTASDKDIVYIPNDHFSIEVKTSSSSKKIFGNRSYAQKSTKGKKAKSGYYLTVNFGKFVSGKNRPEISLIRFGWLDSDDWVGQAAETGQQSHLSLDVDRGKLLEIYRIRVS
jgi:ScaI-like restriction endonuclease